MWDKYNMKSAIPLLNTPEVLYFWVLFKKEDIAAKYNLIYCLQNFYELLTWSTIKLMFLS